MKRIKRVKIETQGEIGNRIDVDQTSMAVQPTSIRLLFLPKDRKRRLSQATIDFDDDGVQYRTPVAGMPVMTRTCIADLRRSDWRAAAEGTRYHAILDMAPGVSVPFSHAACHGTLRHFVTRVSH